MDSCPRCGAPARPGAVDCLRCGVIFARWRPRPGDRAAPALAAGAVAPPEEPAAPPGAAVRDRFAGLGGDPAVSVPLTPGERVPRLRPRRLERLLLALGQALESGLPLPTLAAGPAFADLPAALRDRLRTGLAAGASLSALLAPLLDAPAIALLAAAEERGGIPAALRLLAARIAEARKDRLKLVAALFYPGALAFLASVIVPLPLLVQRDVAGYLARAVPGTFVSLAGGLALLAAGLLLPPGSFLDRGLRRLALLLPPTRAVRLRASIATFASILGEAIRAGLPVRAAAPLAAAAVDHPGVAAAGHAVPARLDEGATLTAALAAIPGLDPGSLGLLDAGERSGRLDESLRHVASDYRTRARTLALALHVAVGSVAAALVAGWIAWTVIQGWTGHFEAMQRQVDGLR